MLHIVTPLFYPQYLEKIWYSINADTDITWHIAKTKTLQLPDYSFLKTDRRIKIYEVDCDESEVYKKRNAIFEKIKNVLDSNKIKKRPILTDDIVQLITKEPDLLLINSEYERNEGYYKSLKEENERVNKS